ncbi:MAG: dihydropteroate synthase, partial [Clostridia bacterium]|nr:dihydropteroate synthase [Clostridia bacterium]
IAQVPVIAKPNAGMPHLNKDGSTSYDMSKEDFVKGVLTLIDKGATILGGCCGTDPEYIAALVQEVSNHPFIKRRSERVRYLSSERKTLTFDLNSPFIIVGERINPTGKKALQDELRNQKFDMVVDFAQQQEEQGAGLLDINMGMSGINEDETMIRAIEEVTQCTSLPVSIDTSHVSVMEHALREYPGRALMNSISYEKVKFESMLPLAAKYGAMFILLPLSDEGLPKDLEEKKEIIRKILERALSLGMHKEDIIVDGLVTTVGANKFAALETLETIRFCKEELGLATIVGLSNISFGLPDRVKINASFLTMAIQAGLTMAIANPSQELLVSSAFAADLLLAKEASDIRYIEYANAVLEANAQMPKNQSQVQISLKKDTKTDEVKNENIETLLRTTILKGRRDNAIDITKQVLESGLSPQEILNQILMPAINEVGALFEKGIYFLPQLIASAETMKLAIEYLEPMLLTDQSADNMPTIVIATVEGDIHDIGKNLVALMLKNYGFHVIDLGKDVTKEVIVKSAIDEQADIIAMSALMTTTMQKMKEVIEYAKQKQVTAKVMIGGAVITQDYADEIGADGYSKDAAEAVKVAKKLLNMEA